MSEDADGGEDAINRGLFDGVEDTSGSEGAAQQDRHLAGSDYVLGSGSALSTVGLPGYLKRWLGNLTYNEVHALVVGFAPIFLGLSLLALPVPMIEPVALAFLVGGAAINCAALGVLPLPDRALRYLVREVHYLVGAAVAGAMLGAVVVAVSRVIGALAGVVA